MSTKELDQQTEITKTPGAKRRVNQISPESIDSRSTKFPKQNTQMNSQCKVGEMTWDQLMTAVTAAVSMAVKDEISTLATKSDMKVITDELCALRVHCADLEAKINQRAEKEKILQSRIDALEQKEKGTNLIFKGVSLKENEQPRDVVNKICTDILGLVHPTGIQKAYKIGPRHIQNPPILVEYKSHNATMEVLRNARKLKGTNIFISRDYTLQVRQKRRVLFKLKQNLGNMDPAKKIKIRDDKMLVEGKAFTVNHGQVLYNKVEGLDILCNLFNNKLDARRIILSALETMDISNIQSSHSSQV